MSNSIEFKGEVYHFNKDYLFSNNGGQRAPMIETLIRIIDGVDQPFVSGSGVWKNIKAIDPATLGTIEKAKLKPKDGEWWMLDFGDSEAICIFKGVDFYATSKTAYASRDYEPLYPMIRNNGGNDE